MRGGIHGSAIVGAWLSFLIAGSATAQTVGMVYDGGNSRVVVFDADSDTVLGAVTLPTGTVCGDCVITPDLALGFVSNFNWEIYVIDLTSSPPVLAAGINPIPISTYGEDLSLTSDGRYLLACDGANNLPLVVVDVASRTEIGTFLLGFRCNSVEVYLDGSVLLTSATGRVRRFTIDSAGFLTYTGESFTIGVPSFANNVVFAPGGTTGVVVTSETRDIRSFTVPGLVQLDDAPLTALGQGTSLVFHPRGDRVYARNELATVDVYSYDAATGTFGDSPEFTITVDPIDPCYGVEQLAIHPSGSKLYVAERESLDVHDAVTGQFVKTVTDALTPQGVCIQARAECFLLVGEGLGDEAFDAGGHTWSTQVAGIESSYPVTMANIPAFELPALARLERKIRRTVPDRPGKPLRRAAAPIGELAVQVVMWNPEVFPSNPEQWTRVLDVTIWSDGTASARQRGTRDGMTIGMETFTVNGKRYVRFPFGIDGF